MTWDVRAHARPREPRPDLLIATYVALVVSAEGAVVFVNVMVGLLIHALIIVAVIARQFVQESSMHPAALALPSLLRILSFAMPIPALPVFAWHVLVGAPVLVACVLAMWTAEWTPRRLIGRPRVHPAAITVMILAVPLGIAAQVSGGSIEGLDGVDPLVGVIVVLGFIALPEELLFRGVLQRSLVDQLGPAGVVLAAVVFSALYLPTLSAGLVVVMFAAGLAFGWSTWASGSVLGAVGAHGVLLVSAWLFSPLVGS